MWTSITVSEPMPIEIGVSGLFAVTGRDLVSRLARRTPEVLQRWQ